MTTKIHERSTKSIAQHVATLLDDLITWRCVGNKLLDSRETANVQPHGGSWMPADRSFDRILLWRTVENNSFQLFEYSLSHNLTQNATQIYFGAPTTVLPNVFIVELPDRQEICIMFATHIGIYRWILKHPTKSHIDNLDQTQSILCSITDDYLNHRKNFYRYDLQLYKQVTCAYTNDHLIYTLFNEMETIVLRFDNTDYLSAPQQMTYPKRQSAGLFNFLWNSNKSTTLTQQNQPLVVGQIAIVFDTLTMNILLYDNGQLRILSDQLDKIIYEHNLLHDLSCSSLKTPTKLFLDYCQYETISDELITRLFIIVDSKDILHILIYELQFDSTDNLHFALYQNKSYTKNLQSTDHSHLPNGSSLTSLTCTNDYLMLHLLTNQNRSLLLLIKYEMKTTNNEQMISLSLDYDDKNINDESTTIDEIERKLNSPGQFTIDMIKDALWITFNLNLDDFNQPWTSLSQILQQLPNILQSLCNEHCEENGIRDEDHLQILTKFWQNLYSTLIDLRANALVLYGSRIFDERQLIILIHKSAISLYSMCNVSFPTNSKFSRSIKDIETLLEMSDDETLARIDDNLQNETSSDEQQLIRQKLTRLQKHLEPIVNNDQSLEAIRAMYDKSQSKINTDDMNNNILASKIARRLLVHVFVRICHEKFKQIEHLTKLLPLVFQSNEIRLSYSRSDKIQETILPCLNDLLKVYQVLLWLSSCGIESPSMTVDDREIFVENLVFQQAQRKYITRIGNQSLIEQILADQIIHERSLFDSENWYQIITNSVNNIFLLLWPSNEFLISYLPTRHQWTILDQYCGKLQWFKELSASRQFFHALAFYRSATNMDAATKHLAIVLKEIRTDPLLKKMFEKHPIPELFYIEWIREYLKYFGQSQHVASFLHQCLQTVQSNDIRVLVVKELFKTSIDLKNFEDAFWCIDNTSDYLSQKQFIFEYGVAVCALSNEESSYRLQKLIQYQCDKLGYLDVELLAFIERTCIETQPIQRCHVFGLYEIYRMIKFPLKMAQIMYHYGCSINDIKEQKNALQLAFDALSSIPESADTTDRLFIYPINYEYNSLAPLHPDHGSVHLIGIDECRQKLAIISAIYTLKKNRSSTTIQITDTMHPTQLSGLLTKFHYNSEAQELLNAFKITKSSMHLIP